MNEIIFSSISEGGELLMASTNRNFLVYSVGQNLLVVKNSLYGGLRFIYNIGASPIYLIVPSGDKPGLDYSPRRPKFWNSQDGKLVHELTLESSVEGCQSNRNYTIFLTDRYLHVFSIEKLKTTAALPRNAKCHSFALSAGEGDLLFYASQEHGHVSIYNCKENRLLNDFQAHRSDLAQMAVDDTSSLLATVSTTGTIIRIFTIPAAELLYSVRIANMSCTIVSLQFCSRTDLMMSATDSGFVSLTSLHYIRKSLKAKQDTNNSSSIKLEDVEDDYCTVHSLPKAESASTSSFSDVLGDVWKSEATQSIVDAGLYSLARLSAFSHSWLTGQPPAEEKMESDQKLHRPLLEEQLEDVSSVRVCYCEEKKPFLAIITKHGIYRRLGIMLVDPISTALQDSTRLKLVLKDELSIME